MSKNQFTGTAMQPQCNRKFCQCNNDQYCNSLTASSRFRRPLMIFANNLNPEEALKNRGASSVLQIG